MKYFTGTPYLFSAGGHLQKYIGGFRLRKKIDDE
jgi:hypothetical protein